MHHRLTLSRAAFSALALMTLILSTGCVPKYTDYEAFMRTPRPIVGGKPYVIEPPDSIEIIAPEAIEIDGEGQGLRPDGYITLHLLGDLFAAGKTPVQLAAEIEEKILRYYQDVTVQVRVTSFNSKRYYMAGETSQGPRQYTGTDTVLDAVLAGGIPRSAWPEKVVVLRPNENADLIRRMSVNMKEMTEKGHLRYNAVLEEGDIVFVPINPLAAVGVFVQNLLSPVDPAIRAVASPGASFSTLSGTYDQGFDSGRNNNNRNR